MEVAAHVLHSSLGRHTWHEGFCGALTSLPERENRWEWDNEMWEVKLPHKDRRRSRRGGKRQGAGTHEGFLVPPALQTL